MKTGASRCHYAQGRGGAGYYDPKQDLRTCASSRAAGFRHARLSVAALDPDDEDFRGRNRTRRGVGTDDRISCAND